MGVTFVIGRAGSGKTGRQFRAIVEAMRTDPLGPPIYWLVPRQATFTAERMLTCQSDLGAYCRARVVSFDEFGRDVFDDCGGSSIPQVTPLGRQMIIGHLLRRHRAQLTFFSRCARQPGLAAELDATFAELERSGKSGPELGQLIVQLSESNAADLELAPLLEKLRDVRLLYDAYTAYLGQDRLDQHRRSHQVQASLSHCSFLSRCAIYVDGFLDFTEYERRILVGAAEAGANVEIALLIDPHSPTVAHPHTLPDEMGLFHRTEEAYRKLYFAFQEQGISIAQPVRLENVTRFTASGPRLIESSLFSDPIAASDSYDGIELIEAPDRAEEVNATARGVRMLLMQGLRLRDIAVIVRDLDSYHALIEASFREHDIPYFVDRRRTAAHHPLIQFLRAAVRIALSGWPHDAVMTLLRSGLAGVTHYDADGLENYVLEHRICGRSGWEAAQPWSFRRQLLSAEEAIDPSRPQQNTFDAIRRRILENLSPLLKALRAPDPQTVRQTAAAVFDIFARFGIRQKLSEWIDAEVTQQRSEQAAENQQVWANLTDLFDQMVELLGEERLGASEFGDVLEAGLESFDLAITPPTVDQVLVGQVDRTRSPDLKAVFVLGLSDGGFPRAPRDGSILTDRERRDLRKRRIDLDPGMHQRLLDERLLGYIAFTRASQKLFVTRPLADEIGKPVEPSSFWRRIEALVPGAPRMAILRSHNADPSSIATPRQLVTALMRWVRRHPDPLTADCDPALPALYQWLAQYSCRDDRIDAMRYRAWNSLRYSNSASLSPEAAGAMFASPLNATVSQLESFAACPFRHFLRYGLHLGVRDPQQVTAQDLGRLYHELLERGLRDVMRRRAQGESSARLEQSIEQLVHEIAGRVSGELMLSNARNRYLLQRTHKTLDLAAKAQREIARRGLFRPAHVGVAYGVDGVMPPLGIATPGGAKLLLHGKIDRVDRVEGSQDAAVIDYRTGPARLPIGMVLHGLSLQLLTNLLVLEANGQRLTGKHLDPAGAFYLQLVRKVESVAHPDDAPHPTDPKWHLKLKPRGLFDRRCLSALDKGLTQGASEVVAASINKDGTLGRRNISDVAEGHEFRAILRIVAQKLGELGDGILSGKIDIAPYRLNQSSPCPRCDYRSVCRFDPAINKYNHLKALGREDLPGTEKGRGDGK